MTITIDRRFLHTLTPTETSRHGDTYHLAGAAWSGRTWSNEDSLSLHVGAAMLSVSRAYTGEGFAWGYDLRIADGVYARHGGKADSIEDACTAAIAYAPERVVLDYLGTETTWYATGDAYLTAAIDGDEARVYRAHDGTWMYSRKWARGDGALRLASAGGELCGRDLPSREDAMLGAIDAPGHFLRACAALISTVRSA